MLEAINRALHECLAGDERVHFLGEDILDPYGGAFKVAQGLSSSFPQQVHTTPVSEAGIVGVGIGMALRGLRPVVEIMFGDFITLAADQLINHAAKLRWMSNDRVRVPLLVRTPMGGRRGYGPTHSQTLERLFLGVPGLRVAALSALGDPAELLTKAILEEEDPLLLIEHKLLYNEPVRALADLEEWEHERTTDRYPTVTLRLAGAPPARLTLAAYGHMASLGMEALLRLAYEQEIFAELVVFSQLSPVPIGPLEASLGRTGRLLTLEEGVLTHGWGAEVVAAAAEASSRRFRAGRVAARDLPVPAAGPLEQATLPSVAEIVAAAERLAGD